jgi:hypothetical protein
MAMTTNRLSTGIVGVLIFGWSAALVAQQVDDEAAARKAADEKFAELRIAAEKDPATTDWRALRRAFAATSHYEPYQIKWRSDLGKVAKDIHDGKVKEAEAAIVKLIEREQFMRIDGHAMAVELYEKSGQSEKAERHRNFRDGLMSAVLVPGYGTSFEKPFEVLFLEEEYMVIGFLGLRVNQQALFERGGHRFDVLTTRPGPGKPQQTFYFNIDMPSNWLQASTEKVFKNSKKADPKK